MPGWKTWEKIVNFEEKKKEEKEDILKREIDSLRRTLEEKTQVLAAISEMKHAFINSRGNYSEVLSFWKNYLDYVFDIAKEHSKE